MKLSRYRLSLSVSSTPPAVFNSEYWPRERTAFLHQFRPTADRYRRRKRTVLYLLLGFMLSGFLITYLNVSDVVRISGLILLLAVLLGAVITFAFGLRLRCPACRKRLEPAKGPYCPQCGSDQFQQGMRTGDSYCPSCDSRILEEDGESSRNYRIRGCTHCGVMLDEGGV